MSSNEIISQALTKLKSSDEATVFQGVKELKKTGKAAVPILIKALKDEKSLRMISSVVLGEFGADAKEAVPELASLLKDDDEDIRMSAALSLMRIGHHSLNALVEVARNTEGKPRFWASWAISLIDPTKIEPLMLKCLKEELDKPSGMVSPFAAEEAIGKIIAMQLKDQ